MNDELIIKTIRQETRKFLRKSANKSRYTLPQAAFRINVSKNRIWKDYVETKKLLAHKDGDTYYISDKSINDFIEKLESHS